MILLFLRCNQQPTSARSIGAGHSGERRRALHRGLASLAAAAPRLCASVALSPLVFAACLPAACLPACPPSLARWLARSFAVLARSRSLPALALTCHAAGRRVEDLPPRHCPCTHTLQH